MKKSPFRNSSSNQEGFGIERNNKRKSSNKKSKKRKKPVAKKQGTSIARKTADKDLIVQNFGDDVFAGTSRIVNPDGGFANKAGETVTYQVFPDGTYREIISTDAYYDKDLGKMIGENVTINEGMNIMDPRLVNPITGMPIGQELFQDNPGNYFGTYQGPMEGPVFQSFSGAPYVLSEKTIQEALEREEQGGEYDGRTAEVLANKRFNKALKEAKKQGNFTKE